MERQRFYETEVDGHKTTVDVATGVVHFDAVVRGDRLIPYKRPVARTDCGACHACDRRVEYKQPDGQPSIIKYEEIHEGPTQEPGPEKYSHKPTDYVLYIPPSEPATPEEVMAKGRKLVQEAKGQKPTQLTVGDLSWVTKEKRKHRLEDWQRWERNRQMGLTVGDNSWPTQQKEKRRMDQLYKGPTIPKSAMSESQEIAAKMMAKRRREQEEAFRIRQIMFDQQQQQESERELAKERRRNPSDEEIDKEVEKALKDLANVKEERRLTRAHKA